MIGSRGDGRAAPGRGVPRATATPVTYALIAACAVAFVCSPAAGLTTGHGTGDALVTAQRALYARWGVIPADLLAGEPRALLTPVTALFVHGGWLHLLGNMLFLQVFGVMAEKRLGPLRYLALYVGCGALALCGYAVAHADSAQTLVGASGAISAVLGAFLCLFPGARVTSLFPFLFFLPLRFPAWVVLPFWVSLQWWAASGRSAGPGVAYLAHLIGFALGLLAGWAARGRPGPRPCDDQGSPRRARATVKPPAAATEGDSKP
ncbi:rhomboid family intramembrane serine protease [Streptomyces sp. NPDC059578]|uniref:rhomboid family intramembrane serine protease n=1 Tax=unclassified Streptomyces TaxID=2593676 RepID=UPI0036566ECC